LQSVAVDVDVDDESGRAIVLGYTCEKNCKPEGQLWLLEDGEQVWQTSIGLHPLLLLRPYAVRWSPARYFVVASGDLEGAGTAFLIRAYAPFEPEPLWTFSRKSLGNFNLALTLAIGAYGEVYAGGYAANSFPAFAIIYG